MNTNTLLDDQTRAEVRQRIDELRDEQRATLFRRRRDGQELRDRIKVLHEMLGVMSAKDYQWADGKPGSCGYCGGRMKNRSSGGKHSAVIRVKCLDCGFEDERDVS